MSDDVGTGEPSAANGTEVHSETEMDTAVAPASAPASAAAAPAPAPATTDASAPAPAAASGELPVVTCAECGATGEVLELDAEKWPSGAAAGGAVPRLPRCACFIRQHRGKLPAAVSSLLPAGDSSLEVPPPEALGSQLRPPAPGAADNAVGNALLAMANPPARQGDAPSSAKPVYCTDMRRPYELMVYHRTCCEEALLGFVELKPEHTFVDVLQMLRDELDVAASAISRGGGATPRVNVPIHRQQYGKNALDFFPVGGHLLVMELEAGSDEDTSE